jgi:hypothetical protein
MDFARLGEAYPREDTMKRIFLILSLLLPTTMLISNATSAETKLAATVFSYDGADFVRTQTTLTQDGQSAAGTKLDRNSAAYKALSQKQSYTGPATLFGHDYDANYAPMVSADGKLTGALFVAVPK